MTSRERLTAAIRREEPDRVPVRFAFSLLNADAALKAMCARYPDQKALYEKIIPAAAEITDSIGSWPMEKYTGFFYTAHPDVHYREYTRPSNHEGYEEYVSELTVERKKLEGIELRSPAGLPPYRVRHMVTTPEDAEVFLSIPYKQPEPDVEGYFELDRQAGDRGIVMVGMVNTIYVLHEMMGSETMALWSMDHRDILVEMLEMVNARQLDMIKYCASRGAASFYGWVGPEICLPPLLSPKDFSDFAAEYDRRLINLIHEAGGLVWVHSHGKMKPVIEKFVEMGVDCLNPVEPPPLGDITLKEAKTIAGKKMCLDGNIQPQEFLELTREQMRTRVHEAIRDGGKGGGFILSPCSSMIEPMNEHVADNIMEYLDAAQRFGKYPLI